MITIKDLKKIGFRKKKLTFFCEMKQKNISSIIYEIKGRANDYIYFNPDEKVYKFYYKTVIGESSNHIHISINIIPELVLMLQIFQIENKFFNN